MGNLRTGRLVVLLAALFLVSLSSPAPASRTRLGEWVKSYRGGYAIRIPDEWSAMPPRVDEPLVLAEWYGPRRDSVSPTLTVLRIPRLQVLGRNEKGELALPDGMRPKLGPDDPVSVRDWLDLKLEPYGVQGRIEERKEIRIGREKGVLYRATYRHGPLVQLFVGVVRTEEHEYGVVLSAEQAEFEEDHERAFVGVIKSFTVLEIESEADVDYEEAFTAEKRRTDDEEQERWIRAVKEKVAETEGWDYLATENYLVLFDEVIRPVEVMRIGVHVEAIRRDVYEKLFPADEPVTAVSIIRVCKDREQYVAYGGPPSSAGYWNSAARELVFHLGKADAIRTLYHEAFHQYIHYAFGQIAPAIWFNEGHGDYFSGFDYRGRFRPGKFAWRQPAIRTALQNGTWVPLREFLRYSQKEYYENAEVCYAQGWSFVYFLRHTPKRQYQGILPKYFDALKREFAAARDPSLPPGTFDPEKRDAALATALEAAFEGIDMERLEQDWRNFGY